jgi:hypothetical protein
MSSRRAYDMVYNRSKRKTAGMNRAPKKPDVKESEGKADPAKHRSQNYAKNPKPPTHKQTTKFGRTGFVADLFPDTDDE